MLGLLDPAKVDEIFAVINSRDKNELLKLLHELQNYDSSSIIDELIENLKYKFIHQNGDFSLLIFERFFRILSEAKSMLNSSADPEFVLFITLFMMLEAFNLTNIDDAISSLKSQNSTPANQVAQIQPQAIPNQTIIKPQSKDDYQIFVDTLYDKSYELGVLFDECVKLIGFENGTLSLEFAMSNEQLTFARKYYNEVILPSAKGVYGQDIKLVVQKSEPKKTTLLSRAPLLPVIEQNQNIENEANRQTNELNSKADSQAKGVLSLKSSMSQEEINLKELKRLFGEPQILSNS